MKVMLPEFERAGVLVVGNVILDRYWYGPTGRISLKVPVLVVKVENIEERPGGVANAATNIVSLGVTSRLARLTGIGDAARVLSQVLANANVRCDFVSAPTHPTTTKLRMLPRNQQLIRFDFKEDFSGVNPQPMHERIQQVLGSIGVLVLSGYAEGVLTNVQTMTTLAREAGVSVLIDPKGTGFECCRSATLLTPNLSEFEAVAGKCQNEAEIVECGMKPIAEFELSALLVTHSEQGMVLLQPGHPLLHMPIQAQEVHDVTGVGDIVIGVLAATLASGNTLEEACYFANAVTGVVVGKLGTSTVSLVELENAVRGRTEIGFGVMGEEELKQAIAAACKRGEKVVMTNGVFDILHAGYVSYLANAHELGDRSIVAVNSDASTKRLKGEAHSANPLEQRMIVLGALEAVDWVVSFEEDTPQRLIAGILSDLLVKGSDYKLEQIAGSEEVWTSGGEVLVLNFEDGCSTTNIIKKIQKDSDK